MARTFTEAMKFWLPSWLGGAGSSGTDDEKVSGSLALLIDDYAARARFGLLARFPGVAVYLDDNAALLAIGRDRRVIRGQNEPAAVYAERLTRAIDAWRKAGSDPGVLQQVLEWVAFAQSSTGAVTPFARMVSASSTWNYFDSFSDPDGPPTRLVASPANWDWDGADPVVKWNRTWLIIDAEDAGGREWVESTRKWGDSGKWGETGTAWGIDSGSVVGRTLKAIVATWKAQHAHCVAIIIALGASDTYLPGSPSGGGLNPDGLHGHWSKVTTVSGFRRRIASRISAARYMAGPR